jgi:hypothetical protein
MRKEARLMLRALVEGWPGLLFLALVLLAAFTMRGD